MAPSPIYGKAEVQKRLGLECCISFARSLFPGVEVPKIILAELAQHKAFSFKDPHLQHLLEPRKNRSVTGSHVK
jgi:hypothetical protein